MSKDVYRGPGQWIFNNSVLKEKEFTDEIKQIIKEFKKDRQRFPNDSVWWDFLKMAMADYAQRYTQTRARKTRETLKTLTQRI